MQDQSRDAALAPQPSFGELTATAARIGLLSFGGPAGQIALMHKVYVDEKRWIDEPRYLSALNFCMLLPGPEAMQLATYVGWRLHGVRGGLVSGLLFVLPGALVVLVLSGLYAALGKLPAAEALFVGVKAAVLAIVVEALLRVSRRALKGAPDWLLAAAAFVAIFALQVPFPLIVLTAAIIGFIRAGSGPATVSPGVGDPPAAIAPSATLRTLAVWLAIWLVPLATVAALLGPGHVLAQLGYFFSKLAIVTFGGAYAVLAYIAQDVVQLYRWLTPGEMLDGLGLAETTPGPLILVTQFVGFLAAYRDGGWGLALAGAVITLWATFAPCFLWIFTGAPYIERLNAMPRLKGALAAVTASVVGVILNLTVWFALHVLFARVGDTTLGPFKLLLPDPASIDLLAAGLALAAVVLLFGLHQGIMLTLATCGLAALAIRSLI